MPYINDVYVNSALLQMKFEGFLKRRKYDIIVHNIFLYGIESDMIAISDGVSHEFEVKCGESDFRKDIKKKRHIDKKPNYFYYVITDESFLKSDHLSYAGVYLHTLTANGFSIFKLIKEPKLIREKEMTRLELYLLLTKLYNVGRIGMTKTN